MEKNEIIRWLREYDGRPVKIMEVCGTHTSALYKTGLRQILSPKIQLLSGPGCPVCVTPTAYIDKLVEISFRGGHRVLAFGDMLAVPGTEMSLAEARDRGASVDFFYNPEDALEEEWAVVAGNALATTPAEAAERVQKLVEALEGLARLGAPSGGYGNSIGNVIAQRALDAWRKHEQS